MRRLVLVAMVAACGGDDDGGGPLTAADLPGAIVNAACSAYVRCGLVTDVTTCRGLNLDFDFNPELAAAVEAGTVLFDETEARLCIAQFGESCERGRLFNDNAHCDLAFSGTVATGGACAISAQCLGQLCNVPSCPDACCYGTCSGGYTPPPRPRVGESCYGSQTCVDSFCHEETAAWICTTYRKLGEVCNESDDCERGYCTGVCTAYPKLGEPCGEMGCGSVGLYCGAGFVCEEYALEGETCGSSKPCSEVYQCTGTCVLGPRVGEPCPQQQCIDQSYCAPSTSRCTALLPDGSFCTSDNECAGECDTGTMMCVTAPICI